MPTYDYKCRECGYRFEEMQSMNADPLKTCPECNTDSLRRLLGAGAGFIFKGSGFYITDYKNNGNSQSEKQKSENKQESSTAKDTNTAKDTSSKSTDKSSTKETPGS